MTPAEKLAISRLAIVEAMGGRKHRKEETKERLEDRAHDEADVAQEQEARSPRPSGNRWFAGMSGAAQAWWRHHPAQLAVEMVTPTLQAYMRRRPFQVLAVSVGVGALVVVTRPWRLISLTTLVVAVVKSSQLSGVVMSALSDAQGWNAQREGREPQL